MQEDGKSPCFAAGCCKRCQALFLAAPGMYVLAKGFCSCRLCRHQLLEKVLVVCTFFSTCLACHGNMGVAEELEDGTRVMLLAEDGAGILRKRVAGLKALDSCRATATYVSSGTGRNEQFRCHHDHPGIVRSCGSVLISDKTQLPSPSPQQPKLTTAHICSFGTARQPWLTGCCMTKCLLVCMFTQL